MKKAIRIGNQTAFSASSITLPFEYAVSNGFDAFEWFPDKTETGEGWTTNDLKEEARARIKKSARGNDIRLSVHVPWQADPQRADAEPLLMDAADLAEDVGASVVIIHFYNQMGPLSYATSVLRLLQRLSPKGISLCIENTPMTGPTDVNRLFSEFRRLGFMEDYGLGMCLDLGHANLCDETRNDFVKFVDMLDIQIPIAHVHMHENYGDADSHLPVFSGPAGKDDSGIRGFLQRMKKCGFSGSIILENWPNPPSLLNQARKRLLELIQDLGIKNKARNNHAGPQKPGPAATPSLEQKNDFAAAIAQADRQFQSWLKKLSWINDCLEDPTEMDTGRLVYLAIYFRFMGTGLTCYGEDGGHYRPSRHAEIAQRIYERLSAMTTPENAFIIRKIYPCLPSFDPVFTRFDPLTRIRDIAHRNDIPQELKREIKTTLQNKLHRSADPEDLATSGRLLERITAPDADYPAGFVDEFKRFHEELKEFFNARSLVDLLNGLLDEKDAALSGVIRRFLSSKKETETLRQQLSALKALSRLRGRLHDDLRSERGAATQKLQLADIKLEEYGFVLLSRLVNSLEALKDGVFWEQILVAIRLSAGNLRLSGFDASECRAIESEINAWSRGFDSQDPVQLIRIKASVQRAGRLAQSYCARILELFPQRVQTLGRLFGVNEHAVSVFAEADIRSHAVFQLSRLVAIALKEIRNRASLPPWDVIVPGSVRGLLREASDLKQVTGSGNEAVIALLEKVEGDEEIPPDVVSLIVARETPHLSHLAVRARQSEVVFAVCEDRNCFSQLRALVGTRLLLEAFPDRVEFHPATESPGNQPGETRRAGRHFPTVILQAQPFRGLSLLTLTEVTPSTGGGKAWAARRLQELSRREDEEFKAPDGMVIPFGVVEELINSDPASARWYAGLLQEMNGLALNDLIEAAGTLKSIVEQIRVPEEILSGIARHFSCQDRLMIRSSSNAEDLPGLSGAGLYDSVANVGLRDAAAAVLRVWASLWTPHAIRSRYSLAIPQDEARMAVLIQKMIIPNELSFIMHTVNPVSLDRDQAYIELAVGMGETLGLAESEGTPYRIACHKAEEKVHILAFADFSQALWPDSPGRLVARPVDYSRIAFSTDLDYRHRLALRLGRIARRVEDFMGKPQDIEGLISGETVYLVQSRPQGGRV